jgi:hypothetical protein
MIIRHTDAEVLQELADILWPYKDPERQWSSDTVQEIADTLALLRPELLPWSMGYTVDHSWAENALACARQRRYYARTAFVMGTGPHEAIDLEEQTINALWELTYGLDDDD